MEIFLVTFIVMLIVVAIMAIGLLQNKQIKGSCGGLNTITGLKSACSCDSPCEKRLAREAEAADRHAETS
ncbi:(Na+)-NQR maturation NqrM [Solemya velum gill symbiont]|uniref:Na(+)-translocating NADH-quinone reductase subunit E n=1 Tax=Solemya velum gill symbiont TaxID=2340 RepID=A0A0B0HBC0_SOVGS|nr:(Na+)-NQR maturation NqrM [Solemya velum gill symbiont]KHF25937.1 hypothetical protein JV46_13650 [Solemya velum gill symbiont]OOY34453.1 hypothetical protein BOV88_09870 [Solemya velum gill symbiont]OOY37165.1 hypothetical protein BOV89_08710 [Solemya velum gill symbiont]OOY41179.1 hypothetical protein BOV90_00145 [Solemya velum gill symbiont]OOY41786.1 hypothetical protein BOV91_09620 [Solemya velum gill symbiont]